MDKGVNFCDTSPRYSEGRGEEGIGRAIKGRRDRFHVCTKFTPNRGGVMTTDAILKQVEGSLRRLGTDCIDVLSVHGANGEEDVLADWIFEAMDRLKQAGKARFFGASVHNTSVAFYRRLIESGRYQVLLIPFNMYYDRTNSSDEAVKGPDALRSVLRLAAEKGVGVIAMKTLAAGGLAKVAAPPGISPAQAKLRWVLRRPEITAIVNEMVTFDFLKEDLAASAADLSPAEEAWLRRCVRDSSDAVCRMCRSCEAACPAKIPIPDLLRLRMYAVDYGDRRRAAELANDVDAVSLLDICRQCGTCEATCPWGVRTTQLLEGLRQIVS
jgi:aryl-alcohol dehydrogenase-like predicted oxidoreductase